MQLYSEVFFFQTILEKVLCHFFPHLVYATEKFQNEMRSCHTLLSLQNAEHFKNFSYIYQFWRKSVMCFDHFLTLHFKKILKMIFLDILQKKKKSEENPKLFGRFFLAYICRKFWGWFLQKFCRKKFWRKSVGIWSTF